MQSDIQTIPWHAIVSRLSALRATHPSALASRAGAHAGIPIERLDAHDVANRIMREENYLIALFNKTCSTSRCRFLDSCKDRSGACSAKGRGRRGSGRAC